MSIVSMSMTSMWPKPESARSFSSSQPSPPAPITRMRHCCRRKPRISGIGSNSTAGLKSVPKLPLFASGPVRSSTFETADQRFGSSTSSIVGGG